MRTEGKERVDPAERRCFGLGRRTRSLARRLVTLLAVATAALASSGLASAATFVVNTVDDLPLGTCDAVHCSLREAITAANANGTGHDLIAFNIALPPPNTITPLTPYPPITSQVTIDGTTEPDYAGTPIIEINGTTASTGGGGVLTLAGGSSTVRGLVLNRVQFPGSAILLQGPGGNLVELNRIGTDVTGTVALSPGGIGVRIHTSTGAGNRIRDNLISGNNYGIITRPPSNGQNVITGNVIGLDATGTTMVSNPASSNAGIELEHDGGSNRIGGTSVGDRNVISAHSVGVRIAGSSNNVLEGNYVGTDAAGMSDRGNQAAGIGISDSQAGLTVFPATNNLVGGTSTGARNVVSGNGGPNLIGSGIALNASGNRVLGNFVGLAADGTTPLGNGRGIEIQDPNNVVGGGASGAGNVVSSNFELGIYLVFRAANTLVEGNTIGLDASGTLARGNGSSGVASNPVFVSGPSGNRIVRNEIAHNGAQGATAGVLVIGGTGTRISENSIHDNNGLGIDLNPFGVTPNDPADVDTGPNELQNFPVLTSTGGTLWSTPNTTFRIEFFSNLACDPSGHGEGERFLQAINVSTDLLGMASFSTPSATNLTATATDPLGNTSEFSNCEPGGPPATQCSDLVDNDGDGLIDYPADPGCESAADDSESPDPPPPPQCSDLQDNDGDGLIDYPADPGCESATDDSESPDPPPPPQCSDLADNDGDGLIDYPADPGCESATDDSESPDPPPPSTCGDEDDDGLDDDRESLFGGLLNDADSDDDGVRDGNEDSDGDGDDDEDEDDDEDDCPEDEDGDGEDDEDEDDDEDDD
jgi:CSLREA domain-containing protein